MEVIHPTSSIPHEPEPYDLQRERSPKRSSRPKKADKMNDKYQPRPKHRQRPTMSWLRKSSAPEPIHENRSVPRDPRYHWELRNRKSISGSQMVDDSSNVEDIPLGRQQEDATGHNNEERRRGLDFTQHEMLTGSPRSNRHIHWEDKASPRGVINTFEWSPKTSKSHFTSVRKSLSRLSAPSFLPPPWISEEGETDEEDKSNSSDHSLVEQVPRVSISSTASEEWEWPDTTAELPEEPEAGDDFPEFYFL